MTKVKDFVLRVIKAFRNYGTWTAIVAFIPIFCAQFGITLVPEKFEAIKGFIYAVLAIFVAAGIVNNPMTANKGFLDDPKE